MSAKPSPSTNAARKGTAGPGKTTGGKSKRSPQAADDATASPQREPAKPQRIRLQRALAAAGFGSRRQCEELILQGRVMVDGEVADQLGTTIDEQHSKVLVDGTPLKSRRLIYYAVNKPGGVVTTNADPEGRPRVIDLVPPDERVFPVGRLDRSSEGLILLTNDGELAQRLAHPRYEVQKVYRVTVAGQVQGETIRQMQQGIYIAEGLVRVEGAKVLKARSRATELEITLKEGKNREIRRILARLGHKVQTLRRIAIGPLRLGEMPLGAYRRLTSDEIKKLKLITEKSGPSASPGRRPRATAGGKRRASATAPARSAKPSRGSGKSATPQALPRLGKLGSTRSGAVIGADPAPEKDRSTTPKTKSHVVRPRTAKPASGGRPQSASGRSTTGRSTTGRSTTGRSAKPRPAGRRKKGS